MVKRRPKLFEAQLNLSRFRPLVPDWRGRLFLIVHLVELSYGDIFENRISSFSSPSDCHSKIHLYFQFSDATLCDRLRMTRVLFRFSVLNIFGVVRFRGLFSWIDDAQFGSECVIARNG